MPPRHVRYHRSRCDSKRDGPEGRGHNDSTNLDRCHRHHARNVVGHFAGKRFPNHDVYVFACKSEKDARKVFGFGLAQHEMHTVVAGRFELRR
jgi:hypothetical protein